MNITKKSSWPLDEASGKHISSITKIIVHLRYLGYIARYLFSKLTYCR